VSRISRHILGLFQGQPGARAWRRHISENAHRKEADAAMIREAAGFIRPTVPVSATGADPLAD
jgi:tRNA-dihydrouridine synthase A